MSDKKGSYNGENVLPKKKREKRLPKRPIEKGKISKLDLNKKIIKVLEGNNIKTIGDLLDQSETDLENIKGLNKKKVKNILAKLENLLKSK
ncbi:MAG: DNA-directed RNA polymerase subunit alpha C-terminal domain-containing protein [Patescibacteria group bacterium]|nr:DNA-directed RNA polymerase subunit alpha C-terminal domain-containing protein [Patescibacteria group bacterium]